jgi:iron complex outermembrane receptor protein
MFGFEADGTPFLYPWTEDYINNNLAEAGACGYGLNTLCLYNAMTGAINPAQSTAAGDVTPGDPGTNPGDVPIRFTGLPIAFNLYRPFDNDWDVWTWRLDLDWQPNPDTLVYLSATTGWRSGGYNLGFFSAGTPEYGAEDIIAYELGYKGTLLDGRMQINTSLYVYNYDDIQTILVETGGFFGTSVNVANFPKARTFGWEGDVTYLLGEHLTLGGNWSYTDAQFKADFDVVDTTNPDAPGSLFSSAELTVQGFDGDSLPKIPKWKFTLWGNYAWPLGQAGTLNLYTTVGYTDEFFFNAPFAREIDRAPSFTRWDARVSWNSTNDQWEISAFVNNITDKIAVRSLEAQGEQFGFQRRATPGDPRAYGISLMYYWNR